jgi:hypothetical protein
LGCSEKRFLDLAKHDVALGLSRPSEPFRHQLALAHAQLIFSLPPVFWIAILQGPSHKSCSTKKRYKFDVEMLISGAVHSTRLINMILPFRGPVGEATKIG